MEKRPSNTHWERIQHVLHTERLSLSALADGLGLSGPDSLEWIKKDGGWISPLLAAQINTAYPAYSIRWLMTGIGPHPGCRPCEKIIFRYPITRKWEMVSTYNQFPCNPDGNLPIDDPAPTGNPIMGCDAWTKGETFAPKAVVWEFGDDRTVAQYESGIRVDTVKYAFDRMSGRLAIENSAMLVVKLTETEMEFVDWSDMYDGAVSRFVFRRIG